MLASFLPTTGLLAAATGPANDLPRTPANGTPQPDGITRPPVLAGNNRPVTHKGTPSPANGKSAATRPVFVYGDGALVDTTNQTEVRTYRRYMAEKKTAPESKAVLLDYFRRQTPRPVGVVAP